jgi:hypothetical protein
MIRKIKVRKDETLMDFKKKAEEEFGIPAHRQRYWTWAGTLQYIPIVAR